MDHGGQGPKDEIAEAEQASADLVKMGPLLPAARVFKEELLTPNFTNPGVIHKRIWYGPLELKPAKVSSNDQRLRQLVLG
jgi:hypothetical protein